MTLLDVTPTFTDGTTAYGSQVKAGFDSVEAVVNGGLDDDNITDDGITASAKIKDGTITSALMASGSIQSAHVNWAQASDGLRAWRSNSYSGANGSRLIRWEKTVALAAVTTEQSFSIDWSTGDSPEGTISFASAPTISGVTILDPAGGMIDATDVIQYIKVGTRSTTGCTILITFSDAPTAGNVILMGLAAGASA